jgi:hypothetical protein
MRRCIKCDNEFRAAAVVAPNLAPVAPVPLPAVLANLQGVATPASFLATRGSTGTTVHLGVGEQVNLTTNVAVPVGHNVKWTVQGDAELTPGNPTVLTAGPTAGTVTVSLVVDGGPHNLRVLSSHVFKVIAPSGTLTRKSPLQPNLRHTQGTAGVGFKMWVNLEPTTVLFDRVQWREHIGLGLATGHFEAENGRIHAPTGVAYNASNQPVSQLSADWMTVYGVNPAPHGINWVGQVDTVDTGSHPPNVAAANGQPAIWKASSHKWNIEWKYRVKRAQNNLFSGEYLLERAMHESTITTNGTATIKKVTAGPFSVQASAATTTF